MFLKKNTFYAYFETINYIYPYFPFWRWKVLFYCFHKSKCAFYSETEEYENHINQVSFLASLLNMKELYIFVNWLP